MTTTASSHKQKHVQRRPVCKITSVTSITFPARQIIMLSALLFSIILKGPGPEPPLAVSIRCLLLEGNWQLWTHYMYIKVCLLLYVSHNRTDYKNTHFYYTCRICCCQSKRANYHKKVLCCCQKLRLHALVSSVC